MNEAVSSHRQGSYEFFLEDPLRPVAHLWREDALRYWRLWLLWVFLPYGSILVRDIIRSRMLMSEPFFKGKTIASAPGQKRHQSLCCIGEMIDVFFTSSGSAIIKVSLFFFRPVLYLVDLFEAFVSSTQCTNPYTVSRGKGDQFHPFSKPGQLLLCVSNKAFDHLD